MSEADFTAEPVERLSGPETPIPDERRGLAVALIAAAALHLLIPLALFVYYALWPPSTPTAVQEIPVEVVVEQPPPPKPKQAEDKPKPPPKPFDEKPAFDAPAPETKENVNRESPDKKTEAPAAQVPPPPTPGAPPKSETQAKAQEADQQNAQNAPKAHDLEPSPEGELPADVKPKPQNDAAEAAAPAAPAPPAKAPVGEALPTIEDLPQYKFARQIEHSPVAGGSAESRYLTIVYGMIKAHLHETPELHVDSASKRGVVDFYVDEGGNLVGRKLISSSGSPNLDIAVMTAIAEAAPYPAPPSWRPLYLTYNFGRR